MAVSLDRFTQYLAESSLLSADDVAAVVSSLPKNSRPVDGEQLARVLVKLKKLTAYQAQQIYAGKGKALTCGNYLILDKLGQGGMGMVLKAEHRRMRRVVALKVLSPAVTKNADMTRRFQREVEAAAKLEHPNIVTAYDADEANGTHFLVMQFVDGNDLAALVKAEGPLPVERAVNCIIQAARGLEYAHEQGVIHRDIKPANLLIDQKGVVKILDMGLARIDNSVGGSSESAGLTNTGTIMGTVDYMSPEQAMDTKHADARSDIYSLGMSLFFLLTGRAAYDGDTIMKKLMAHQAAPIPSLLDSLTGTSAGVSQLPPEFLQLQQVFERLVAKRPDDRPQTMTQVIAELQRCIAAGPVTVQFNSTSGTSASGGGTNAELQQFFQHFSGAATPSGTKQLASSSPEVAASQGSGEGETLISSVGQVGAGSNTEPSVTLSKSERNRLTKGRSDSTAPRALASRKQISMAVGGGVTVALILTMFAFSRPPRKGHSAQEPGGHPRKSSGRMPVDPNVPSVPADAEPEGGSTLRTRHALEFDGVDDTVEIPSWTFADEGPVTMEALALPVDSEEVSLAHLENPVGMGLYRTGSVWHFQHASSQGEVFHFVHEQHVDSVPLGRPIHLAGVWTPAGARLFYNGKMSTKSGGGNYPGYKVNLLGAVQSTPNEPAIRHFKGTMWGFRVSRIARYDKPFTPPDHFESDDDTVLLYRFNEGEGDELTDSSGNNHHGKIVGPKWVNRD